MPTALTIDQNDNVRHLIREVLQHAGYRVAEAANARPRTSALPVVITTGVPEPDIDYRLRRCGASAYLLKPFGPRDLVQAVTLALALTPQPAVVGAEF